MLRDMIAGRRQTLSGLPEDVEVEAVHYSTSRDCWKVRVSSETWEPVKEGKRIPIIVFSMRVEEGDK
jgi:hypothetical protein